MMQDVPQEAREARESVIEAKRRERTEMKREKSKKRERTSY